MEPELFATYVALCADSREVVGAHVRTMTEQLTGIVADGVASGEFIKVNPESTGRALFVATTRFHNPAHAAEWGATSLDTVFDDVWALLIGGLTLGRSALKR